MATTSLATVNNKPAYRSALLGAYQSMLWQHVNTVDGPDEHLILAYTGTGIGGPSVRALSRTDREHHPEIGWEVIARIQPDGSVVPVGHQ